MRIVLNGRPHDVADGTTLGGLVDGLDLFQQVIAVELNREVVRKGTYGAASLRDGDVIEIVTLVGGG